MAQAVFGQTVALADALVTALNAQSASLALPILAVRTFARKLDLGDIPAIGEKVMLQIIPGEDLADRIAMNNLYDDTYGVHVLMLQRVSDAALGGISEAQVGCLMQLRSEIIEFLCGAMISCPAAVHPFARARVTGVRHGAEGAYDLSRLESEAALFYSDTILTYKAAGLCRRNP